MPTRAVFRCQFCDAVPDHGTQRSLAGQVTERMFGEYLDAFPGRWLVWNGGGPLGPRRYACREHRGDLVAYLRYHYATVAAQVWKMPPYQARWPDEKRPHMGGSMGIVKFGLRGGLLQDRQPPAKDEHPPGEAAGPPGGGEEVVAGDTASSGDAGPAESPGEAARFPAEELLGPEDADAPSHMFPPGELFLPADGLFGPGGGSGSSETEGYDDGAWPSDAPDFPPDDGQWPAGPPDPPPPA